MVIKIGAARTAELRLAAASLFDHPAFVPIRHASVTAQGEPVIVQDIPKGEALTDVFARFDGQYRVIAQLDRKSVV